MLLPIVVSFALKPHMENPQNHGNQYSSLHHPRMSFHSVFFLCKHLERIYSPDSPSRILHFIMIQPPKNDRGNASVGKREKNIQNKQQPKPSRRTSPPKTTQTLSGGLYGILPTSKYFQQERSHDDPIDDQIFCDGAEWLGLLERRI